MNNKEITKNKIEFTCLDDMMEKFKKGDFVVNCQTEKDAERFMKICDDYDLYWFEKGDCLTDDNEWTEYWENTCYGVFITKKSIELTCEGDIYYICNTPKIIITYNEFIGENNTKNPNAKEDLIKRQLSNIDTLTLFSELQSRLELNLKDNEVPCPNCHGLTYTLETNSNNKYYLQNCINCHTGKVYKCKHCGKLNNTDWCNCDKSKEEQNSDRIKEFNIVEQEQFNVATKIPFNEYDGLLLINDNTWCQSKEDVKEYFYELIKHHKTPIEDLPKFLWATDKYCPLYLNLKDIIQEQCADEGYEDMYDNLDINSKPNSHDLSMAQCYLNMWLVSQGDRVYNYQEDVSKAILLDDIYKEIQEEINSENKEL